jgi:hypothetical protein
MILLSSRSQSFKRWSMPQPITFNRPVQLHQSFKQSVNTSASPFLQSASTNPCQYCKTDPAPFPAKLNQSWSRPSSFPIHSGTFSPTQKQSPNPIKGKALWWRIDKCLPSYTVLSILHLISKYVTVRSTSSYHPISANSRHPVHQISNPGNKDTSCWEDVLANLSCPTSQSLSGVTRMGRLGPLGINRPGNDGVLTRHL